MEYETVPHSQNNAAEVADFYNRNEALADPVLRREYFANLDPDDFLSLLQQVNAVVRTGSSDNLQPFDGENVSLGTHMVPDQADKPALLRETWEVARKFLQDPKLQDDDALTYAGLVSAGGLLLAHPFIDSNGRTSRVLSHMLMCGSENNTAAEVERILSEKGQSEWEVTPLANLTATYASYEYERDIDIPYTINWGDADDLMEVDRPQNPYDSSEKLAKTRFNDRALHMFMSYVDEHGRNIINHYVERDEEGTPTFLDAEKALVALTNDPENGIKYAAQLSEAERWSRTDYVRRYLKAMQREDAMEPAGNLGKKIKILEGFSDPSPEITARVRAFGRYAVEGKYITPRDHSRLLFESSSIPAQDNFKSIN